MEDDFEKCKQLFIESIEGLVKLWEPYVKLAHSSEILGLIAPVEDKGGIDYDLFKLEMNALLSGLREADTPEAVKEVLRQYREYLEMFFPNSMWA